LGAGDLNLTYYQGAFIQHLVALNVPTIIIGGKARAFHFNEISRDLDLWMPADNAPQSPVRRALITWSARYPSHSWPPLVEPFEIKPLHMIQFPNADVSVLTDTGKIEKVTNDLRVDILFCLPGFSFESAYADAARWKLGGNTVRILSENLLGPTAALKRS
jgi:hypothetical protein